MVCSLQTALVSTGFSGLSCRDMIVRTMLGLTGAERVQRGPPAPGTGREPHAVAHTLGPNRIVLYSVAYCVANGPDTLA
jgi:hypothetical protein